MGGGWAAGLLDVVFPPACAACSAVLESPAPLCAVCALGLSPLPVPHCPTCAEPTELPSACARCDLDPPPFSRVLAPFVHEGPLARAIHRLKYEDHPELAVPLAALVSAAAAPLFEASGDGELIAILLHPTRLRERRFDQAQLLARALSRRSSLALVPRALFRTRATVRQVGLSDAARERNLEGAFLAAPSVRGRRLILVDDVLTTGATARAAARALLAAGAADVAMLAVARALGPVGRSAP